MQCYAQDSQSNLNSTLRKSIKTGISPDPPASNICIVWIEAVSNSSFEIASSKNQVILLK